MLFQSRDELKSWLLRLDNESVSTTEACGVLGLPALSLPPPVLSKALVYFVHALPSLSCAVALWSARPSHLDAFEDRLVLELTACLPGHSPPRDADNNNSAHANRAPLKRNANEFDSSQQLGRLQSQSSWDSNHDSPDLSAIFSKPNSFSRQPSDLLLRLDEEEANEEQMEVEVNWQNLHNFISSLADGRASQPVLENVCRLLGLPCLISTEFDLASHCTSVYYLLICSSYWSSARLQCAENGILRLAEEEFGSLRKTRLEVDARKKCEVNNNNGVIGNSRDENNNRRSNLEEDPLPRSAGNRIISLASNNNNNNSLTEIPPILSGNNATISPKKGGKLLRRDCVPSPTKESRNESLFDSKTSDVGKHLVILSINNNNYRPADSAKVNSNQVARKLDLPTQVVAESALASPKKRSKPEDTYFSHHNFKKTKFSNSNAHTGLSMESTETSPKERERRQMPFLSAPPVGALDRIDRARTQRMYLILKKPVQPDSLTREYVVLGSMGNVYNVVVGPFPSCDCPDHLRGNLCKHILFIYLKVLKVKKQHLLYQTSLLNSELKQIFEDSDSKRLGRFSIPMANETVREKYEQLLQEENEEKNEAKSKRKEVAQQEIDEASQCPVCCEEFMNSRESVVFCRFGCGNNIHSSCFNEWCKMQPSYPTCVICRSLWSEDNYEEKRNSELKAKREMGSYMNLGEFQPQSGDCQPDVMDESQGR